MGPRVSIVRSPHSILTGWMVLVQINLLFAASILSEEGRNMGEGSTISPAVRGPT